jgi:4-aminobutyrate aminotransferase/(S)-3-amino-2-methylpropionate transaminase
VLEILHEDRRLDQAVKLGETLRARLTAMQQRFEIIGDVRGKGPMLAMELVADRESKAPAADKAKALVGRCFEKGLVLLSCGNFGNVIRTLMPLVITDDQLDKGLAILEESLEEVSRS